METEFNSQIIDFDLTFYNYNLTSISNLVMILERFHFHLYDFKILHFGLIGFFDELIKTGQHFKRIRNAKTIDWLTIT